MGVMARTGKARPRGRFENRHSNRVARLKILLPLTALAILSTLFLLADRRDRDRAIHTDLSGPREDVTAGRVGRPDFAGIGRDGAGIFVSAADAWPDGTDGAVTANDLTGIWEGRDGGRVVASSTSGVIGPDRSSAELRGAVDIESDTGYRLKSDRLDIDIEAGRMVSPGPVAGTGPNVRIDAGAMEVRQVGEQALLSFTAGVKVVYDPSAPRKDRE